MITHTHSHTHLSLGRGDSSPARVDLLVDGGQEVLRDPQSVLQQREVRVVLRSVFQQVLQHMHKHAWLQRRKQSWSV